ncbi:MAG: PorT family protein [Flavobacteriaceae bacterium]|nr:PorT family protein [Flavobacteriaceae bacterium]
MLRAQNNDTIKNTKYLEDQIYIGFSIATLINTPKGITQNGLSNSIELGIIKDIPINDKGDFAFGIGLGYGRNTYFQNIKIEEINNITQFQIAAEGFKNNKFSTHTIDVPLEIRWRTSTINKYKFWRIYAGGKLSYVFASNARFKEPGNTIKVKGISEINKLQYGLKLAVGYGTWNFNFYYGLTDLFSNANLNETTPIEVRDFRIGLIFYIL